MKRKFRVTLVVFLVIILGCFSEVFAADINTNNSKKKVTLNEISESEQKTKMLDSSTAINYAPKKDYSSNLIANYKLDETTGTTCIDSVNNNSIYNGTYSGTKSVTDDFGTYRSFNGKSDFISFTNSIIPTGKKSIKFKIKTTNKALNQKVIIGNDRLGTKGYGTFISFNSNNRIWAVNDKGTYGKPNFSVTSNKDIADGKWHDILYTWDGTTNANAVKLYIDDMVNPNAVATALQEENNKTTSSLLVGKWIEADGTNSFYFDGGLSDIQIYNDVVEYSDNGIITGLTLNKTTDTLNVGEVDNLIATITPENAVNKSIKWTSSDPTIATVDDNGKITALKKGTATITATTQDGSNLSASCAVTVNDPLILNIEPEKTKINLNDTVSANLTIDNIQDIAAEDIRIKYDSTKLKFLGYEEVDGIKLVKDVSKDGELRVIIASKGKANIINAKKALLKLNFKGIATGDALVDVTKGRVSDGITKEWDLTDEQCGQATITIQGAADVDNSGEFTLLDLAIDARHQGEDPSTLPQYSADQDGNKAIDDGDLTQIGQKMLDNSNYQFNKEN